MNSSCNRSVQLQYKHYCRRNQKVILITRPNIKLLNNPGNGSLSTDAVLHLGCDIVTISEYITLAMSGTKAQILEIIQNKCLRIITKAHSRTHRDILQNLTHIPSLASRHTYLYLCEFYELYKNISPKLLNDMLIVNTESMYDSRSAAHCNVKIPRMNKRVGQRSLNYLGPITFNSLPTNIKTTPSFSIFKKRLERKSYFNFNNVMLVYKSYA